jgi:hypothetical protein
MLPHWFTTLQTELIFNEKPNGVKFPAFAGDYKTMRLYYSEG